LPLATAETAEVTIFLSFRLAVIMSHWPAALAFAYCLDLRNGLLELLEPSDDIPNSHANKQSES